jgi:hypothetical protein
MMRRCAFLAVVGVMATIMAALAAQAAEDVLKVIPRDALGFAAINRLAETDAKLQKLSQQVQAPVPGLLAMLKERSGIEKGLDESGSAVIIFLPGSGDPAKPVAVVALVPVTDYQQFLTGLGAQPAEKLTEAKMAGQDMVIGNRDGYAVIGASGDRAAIEKVLASKQSVADEYSPLTTWMKENDVVAVATAGGLKMASQAMQAKLQQFAAMMAQVRPEDQAAMSSLGMLQPFLKNLEKEVGAIGIAERIDKEGTLRISTRTRFASGSAVAAKLGTIRPAKQSPLAGLPGAPFAIAGGGPWSDSMQGELILKSPLVKQSFRQMYGLDDKQIDEMNDIIIKNAPKGIRGFSMTMGAGRDDEPILHEMAGVYRVDDAAGFLDAYQKYCEAIREFENKANSPKLKIAPTVKKTEMSGRPALELEMAFPPEVSQAPGFGEKMSKLFGSEGKMRFVLIAADDHTVAYTVADEKPVSRILESLKQGSADLSADPNVAKTAALMPKDAQWAIYVSPSGATALINRFLKEMLPDGAPRPNIPEFPTVPPIGIAIATEPLTVKTEIVVPVSVLDAAGKYADKVRNADAPAESESK